jgi:multidrug efflux system membrane fusion protein
VKTGEQQDGKVVILEGLKPGDRVVTLGQLRLQNGAAVTLADDAAMPPRTNLPRY